jgi:hypothetical protein
LDGACRWHHAWRRTHRQGRENSRIRIHANPCGGRWAAVIHGTAIRQTEATFTEFHNGETEIGFENREHDFPQRVIYKLQGKTRLLASIEGMRKGVARTIDFPMHRAGCGQ